MIGRTVFSFVVATVLASMVLAANVPATPQVNVNTASVQELQLLPRVGPAIAQRIVEFRNANGPFKTPEELIRVKGIGEKTFANLQPYVAVSGTTTLKEKVRIARKASPSPVKQGD